MGHGNSRTGITLLGLVILLVIVALGIGMAMMQYSALRTSEIRTGLSEIEKYQSATRMFREKYGYLPGDVPGGLAGQLKFTSRGGAQGRGDGNGLVEGYAYLGGQARGTIQTGEPLFFWEDLYSALLIKEPFTRATDMGLDSDVTADIADYLPEAHMGLADFIYVYSDKGTNYYGVSAVTKIDGTSGDLSSHAGLTAKEAYAIDRKLDDGIANSGRVMAHYVNVGVQDTSSAMPTFAFCYDAASGRYSQSAASQDISCALSFAFVNR